MGEKRGSPKPKSPRVFGHPPRRLKTPFRAGLYARVSTQDQQTIPLQTRALREYAARRGWRIVLQVKEIGSGAAQRERREKLMEAARRREIDVVLVWRLDRWGRSVTDLLATLQELEHLGVGFVSLTEALDLTTPAGRAIAGGTTCGWKPSSCRIRRLRTLVVALGNAARHPRTWADRPAMKTTWRRWPTLGTKNMRTCCNGEALLTLRRSHSLP